MIILLTDSLPVIEGAGWVLSFPSKYSVGPLVSGSDVSGGLDVAEASC